MIAAHAAGIEGSRRGTVFNCPDERFFAHEPDFGNIGEYSRAEYDILLSLHSAYDTGHFMHAM